MRSLGGITGQDGSEFVVHAGISESLIGQLVAASNSDDTALTRFTKDPQRFATQETVNMWLDDTGRHIYSLTPALDETVLAGFVWFRTAPHMYVPDICENEELWDEYKQTGGKNIHTAAIRMYSKFRGQKLAIPFMQEVQKDYIGVVGGRVVAILVDINRDNTSSQRLFEKLGYQLLGPQEEKMLWVLDYAHIQKLILPD